MEAVARQPEGRADCEAVGVRMSWSGRQGRRWRASGSGLQGRDIRADGGGRGGRNVRPMAKDTRVRTLGPLGCRTAGPPATQQLPPHALSPLWPVLPRTFSKILEVMLNRCSSVKCSRRNLYILILLSLFLPPFREKSRFSLGQSRTISAQPLGEAEDLSPRGWRAWRGGCPHPPPGPPCHPRLGTDLSDCGNLLKLSCFSKLVKWKMHSMKCW